MNNKTMIKGLRRLMISTALSGALFLLLSLTTTTMVHAENCTHEEYAWVTLVNPTCSKPGKKAKICQRCEAVLETENIEKTEHQGKWEKTKEATCSETGVKSYVCKNCNTTIKTEAIPKKNHSFAWTTTKNATCREKGTKVQQCSYCGAIGETKSIQKQKHKYKWEKTKNATCSGAGMSKQKCKECGYVNATKAVAATGKHKYGKWSIRKIAVDGRAIKVTQMRTCKDCKTHQQIASGTTAAFSQKHDKSKYYYKYTQKSGRIVLLCSECHQSVTGKITGTTIQFTKPRKDNSKCTSKTWKTVSDINN
ncbi:hypothetical protein [Butyrivibrio sp. AE3004]|uniref:hypothetical protein n=1 Tax=Butyrivibrio sp. AE3004 TaxID=1506994 RepID=UPI000494CF25|nr:hypothetical protein [Butyrivibrio sp. AE3004]